MSRLLLLSILVLWMCPRENVVPPPWSVGVRVGIFVGVYGLLILLMCAWSRLLARRVADDTLGRTLDRYNRATEWARYFIPAWFAVGVFGLGWGHIVFNLLAPLQPAGLPRMEGASMKSRFRHYLNLHKTSDRLRRLAKDFAWGRMDTVFAPILAGAVSRERAA